MPNRNSATSAQTPTAPAETEALRLNLLTYGVITISHDDQNRLATLPQTYAALATDQVDDFPALRFYQKHFWHATLCQIGAMAMVKNDLLEPPTDADTWAHLLRALTVHNHPDDAPWHLVVDDISQPAFMQPPAIDLAAAQQYTNDIVTPDQMDLPVGSKNHDTRSRTMRHADPEHWLYSLVARQTGGGYDGNRLYGTSRMNSGTGNRHGFSLTPSTRWGPHVTRDLRILARAHQGQPIHDLLLWTIPWHGAAEEAIPLVQLHPSSLYVEISRRIRLHLKPDGQLAGRYASSAATRIDAKAAKGLTEDPWTVTEAKNAVTVSNEGFSYRHTARYLDPERFTLPILARHHPEVDQGQPMYLVARTIVRGQGKTEGYHEITIPLAPATAQMFQDEQQQAQLHQAAQDRLNIISEVQSILNHAVKTYLQNGMSGGKARPEHQRIMALARRRLQQSVEADFWYDLQEELASAEPQLVQAEWCHHNLVQHARSALNHATNAGVCQRREQYHASTEAHGILTNRVRNSEKLPQLPETTA